MRRFILALAAVSVALSSAGPAVADTYNVTNNSDAGAGSLRKAIADANTNSGADTVTFSQSLSGLTIRLDTGELTISDDLTIDASNLPVRVTISGDANDDGMPTDGVDSRVFLILSGGHTVLLDSLTITGGYPGDGNFGGGIYNGGGTLTVANCTLVQNRAGDHLSGFGAGNGGGIYNSEGTLTVANSTFTENRAGDTPTSTGGDGGGIFSDTGTLTITKSKFAQNRGGHGESGGGGGAIFGFDAEITIEDSTFEENAGGDATDGTGGAGGGIYRLNGNLTVTRSTFFMNHGGDGTGSFTDGGDGGGICAFGNAAPQTPTVTIANSTFTGNRAGDSADSNGGWGGGAFIDDGSFTLANCTFTQNRAGNAGEFGGLGGGLYLSGGSLDATLSNSIVAGNAFGTGSANDGGGPDIFKSGSITRSGPNLIGDNSTVESDFPAPATPGQPNANGDLVGTSANPLDPKLGPLANNGGPTKTRNLLAGSPAINFGDATAWPPDTADLDGDMNTSEPITLTTDQRGLKRIRGPKLDLGAVEVQPKPAITDTWSAWYGYANTYYAYYAALGFYDYAFAFYFYYVGIGDYYYYSANGNAPLANYQYYVGLAYYFYYAYSSLGGGTAAYNFYLNFAYAYYFYYLGVGDSSSASYFFNYYYSVALSLL